MIISAADAVQLGSKITSKRLANMHAIWRSYRKSRRRGEAKMVGLPWSISIEPTTACNLRCPECPSGLRSFSRPTGKLDQELFSQIINELHEELFYLIFYFQGEPYLHPDFLLMVSEAEAKDIYTATSTNAHFLDDDNARKTVESGMSRLIISIDGSTQETYESYRKTGSLDKVLEGTRNVLKWRKKLKSRTPSVLWQFLVVRPNEHQIPEIKSLAREIGVDKVAFKSAQIYDYESGNDLIPSLDKYSRYYQNGDGKFHIKNKMDDHCWKMWHSCVITWDGQVVPCCFDKDAEHPMGQLGSKNFSEIWQSESYDNFRNTLLRSRSEVEMCKNCSEGTPVWV